MFVEYFLCLRKTSGFPGWGKNPKAASKTGIGRVGRGRSHRSQGHLPVGGAALVGTEDLFPAPLSNFPGQGSHCPESGTDVIQLLLV